MNWRTWMVGAGLAFPMMLLTGCGATMKDTGATVAENAVAGRIMGGQQPIVGATVTLYAYGNAGYGSTATALANTTTDAGGNFSFAAGAYTCPQANTPVYIISAGGDPGGGVNANAVLGSVLGTCGNAPNQTVIINEVTTVALAYSLSHYFTTTFGAGSTDSFGGPSTTSAGTLTYAAGLTTAANMTAPSLVNYNAGYANTGWQNVAGVIEADKIYTIANVLAACVNTTGQTSDTDTSTTCGKLFSYTQVPGSNARPSDTLQAAVGMCLAPAQYVAPIFNLIGSHPQFAGGSGTAPTDWSLAVSYVNTNMSVAQGTNSNLTMDIDLSGNVWFPTTASTFSGTTAGVAYFNPATKAFNGPYNSTGMVFPQQVVLDGGAAAAWVTDRQSSVLSGYSTTAPATTSVAFSITTSNPTVATALTVGDDNRVNVAVAQLSGGVYSSPQIANVDANRTSYSLQANTALGTPAFSLTGDFAGGEAIVGGDQNAQTFYGDYLSGANPPFGSANTLTQNVVTGGSNPGSVVYTGNDFVASQPYTINGSTSSVVHDGLCVYSTGTCYPTSSNNDNGVSGLAVDGDGTVWAALQDSIAVAGFTPNGSGTSGLAYVNYPTSGSQTAVSISPLKHPTTMVAPVAVAVDGSGNVWLLNAGCTGDGCNPQQLVLTELIGAAAPTITPVANQVVNNSSTPLTGTRPTY